jgi:DNA repair protein RadC
VLEASPETPANISGLGETSVAALKVARAVALRMLRTEVKARSVLAGWQALLDYLTADLAHVVNEHVRVLHLDSRNRLSGDELMWEGMVNHSAVHVRELMRRAMKLGSAALILSTTIRAAPPRPAARTSPSPARSSPRASRSASPCTIMA